MTNDVNDRMRKAGWCQVKEAATITGLNARQIYRLIEKFGIPTQRIGGDGTHKPGRRGPGIMYLQLAPLFSTLGRTVSEIVIQGISENPPPEPPLSFTRWLRLQQGRDDAVGRFAKDWSETDSRPRSNDWASILGRLCEFWHADEAAKALTPAWNEYNQYRAQKIQERSTYDLKKST